MCLVWSLGVSPTVLVAWVVLLNSRYTSVVTSERFGRCVVALVGL